MNYQVTRFVMGAHELRQLPQDIEREIAFAGRSNVGKSSALNAITQQNRLARISKTPGRTQQINVFEVVKGHCLIDLPGYGYAKVPETLRRHWQTTLANYFNQRLALRGLFLLLDCRQLVTPLDQQMLDYCDHRRLDVHLLLTKADKLSRGGAAAALLQVQKQWPSASVQLFSSLNRVGIDTAHAKLDEWFAIP